MQEDFLYYNGVTSQTILNKMSVYIDGENARKLPKQFYDI